MLFAENILAFLFYFFVFYICSPTKKRHATKSCLFFFLFFFLFHNQQLNYSHEIKTGALWNQQEWAKYEVAATDYLSSSMLKGDDRGNLMDWMKYRNILNRVSNICENYIKIKNYHILNILIKNTIYESKLYEIWIFMKASKLRSMFWGGWNKDFLFCFVFSHWNAHQ